jgi:hypothetical protein
MEDARACDLEATLETLSLLKICNFMKALFNVKQQHDVCMKSEFTFGFIAITNDQLELGK